MTRSILRVTFLLLLPLLSSGAPNAFAETVETELLTLSPEDAFVWVDYNSARFAPLMTQMEYGFDINPVFEKTAEWLVQTIALSYDIKREYNQTGTVPIDPEALVYRSFTKAGWVVEPLQPENGELDPVLPGILAYHPKTRVLVLSFRGTMDSEDLRTNSDFSKVELKDYGIGIPGNFHRGYAIRAQRFLSHLVPQFQRFLSSLSENERSDLLIFSVGHSMGGSFAQLAAAVLIQYYQENIDPSFDNRTQNKFQVFRLASSRSIGSEECQHAIEELIGKQNNITQNTRGDILPNLFPGQTIQRIFSQVTPSLASHYTGYHKGGFQAIQTRYPTVKSIMEDRAVSNKVRSRSKLWDQVLNFFAIPHYVSSRGRGGNAMGYDPKLVDLDTRNQLSQGYAFRLKQDRESWMAWLYRLLWTH